MELLRFDYAFIYTGRVQLIFHLKSSNYFFLSFFFFFERVVALHLRSPKITKKLYVNHRIK